MTQPAGDSSFPSEIFSLLLDRPTLLRLMKAHPWWLAVCLALTLALEGFFWIFPPRGMVTTDVIHLGAVFGTPLADFSRLWTRLLNDDQLMLRLVRSASILPEASHEELLEYLAGNLRKNLSFSQEQSLLVKISLRQGRRNMSREILNRFTQELLATLRIVEEGELSLKRGSSQARLARLNRLSALVRQAFGLHLEDIPLPLANYFSPFSEAPGSQHGMARTPQGETVIASGTILSALGNIGMNEVDYLAYLTSVELDFLVASQPSLFQVYPRESRILSDPNLPPQPVQPAVVMIYFLLPIALSLFYLGGLLAFGMEKGRV